MKKKVIDYRRVKRIESLYTNAFARATQSDIIEGAAWYDTANKELSLLALKYDLPLDTVVAACAALSPRLRWSLNVLYTDWVIRGNYVPHIQSMVNKARAIIATNNPSLVTARKTSSFAANILGDTDKVTIDVWMYRLAGIDTTKKVPAIVYDECELAVKRLSRSIGYLNPAQLQAILWLIARR